MDFKWYTLTVAAGFENKVCDDINKLAETNELFEEAFVPTRKVMRIVKGVKEEKPEKLYNNYIFVKIAPNKVAFEAIRNLNKVLGFLGQKFKPEEVPENKVLALKVRSEEEANIEEERFNIGDSVKITAGPFDSFIGVVEGRDDEKKILKISISIFGRETLVDIDLDMIEKV